MKVVFNFFSKKRKDCLDFINLIPGIENLYECNNLDDEYFYFTFVIDKEKAIILERIFNTENSVSFCEFEKEEDNDTE